MSNPPGPSETHSTPRPAARADPAEERTKAADPKAADPKPPGPKSPDPKAAGPKTAGPRTTGSRAKSSKAGGPRASTSKPADAGSLDGAGANADDARGQGAARRRNRALYSRRLQRTSERWPTVTRVGTWLFSHPDLVLGVLGSHRPQEVDGRVLNPGVHALLETLDRVQRPIGRTSDVGLDLDPVEMRSEARRTARIAMPIRTDVHVSGRVIPGPVGAPAISLRVFRQYGTGLGSPPGPRHRHPAIVYFHGGGWVTGDLDSHDSVCRLLAAASGCTVVAVDYRLAPEHPYPAAVEDALAAYAWVHDHADELGIETGQVGVMGDSAGGNLAAVVAHKTRDATASPDGGVPPPVVQGLVYPVVDARLVTGTMRTLGDRYLLTSEMMEWFRDAYVPERGDREEPGVSPLLAEDHRGLAPALVVTAGFDPLRDDGANYAAALRGAGVDVEHRCYDDQVHGFMNMGIVPDCLALATEVCEAMGRMMRRSAPAGARA